MAAQTLLMRHLRTVFQSRLLPAILLTALVPLSFRVAARGRPEFLFLEGRGSMVAVTTWALCATLVIVSLVRGRRRASQ